MRPAAFLAIALLLPGLRAGDVIINEINYSPANITLHQEFIELYNQGTSPVDLSGWFFSSGIRYTFPAGTTIAPDGYVVVAENPAALVSLGCSTAIGPFDGGFSGSGETVILRDAAGAIQDDVTYGIGFPWPTASDGEGSSMELVNPSLDRHLGGSWRASGASDGQLKPRVYYIDAQDPGWHYRKGTSEASSPTSAWRAKDFVEDATWLTGPTSIGWGGDDDQTVLSDMQGSYTCLFLRHKFTATAPFPGSLLLNLYSDDGAIVWINGTEVARVRVSSSSPVYTAKATAAVDPTWDQVVIQNPGKYLVDGDANVIAVQVLGTGTTTKGISIDLRLFIPGSEDVGASHAPPTPGKRNSVYAGNAPPQVRNVRPTVLQPASTDDVKVTAKVTDPDGVRSVVLRYQVVDPGNYIPAYFPVPVATLINDANKPRPRNLAFEDPASWTAVTMTDDGKGGDAKAGDGVYTAVIPGQLNRALVRYRIAVEDDLGASVRVPYLDDPSLNFAYFVYDGVPDYSVATSISGKATVYPAGDLTSVAVYFLITRKADLDQCIAINAADQIPQGTAARFSENWEGTWVYEGVVYDHINYRLRGANGRYQTPASNPGNISGKRHYHIKFNKGADLQTRDRWGNLYPSKWKALLTSRMFGNRLDGNWGLNEQVNDVIWNAYGVPAPNDHPFHWRVIWAADEAPDGKDGQYLGDFWGLAWAMENYDSDFLDVHGLPKGNLYKLINQTDNALDQQHYQAEYAVTNGRDHDNIANSLSSSQPDSWLLAYVDYDEWYRYHSLCQAFRHYDYWPTADKNAAWYFYPDYNAANKNLGVMQTFPFDTDATWGATWNDGQDKPYDAIYAGKGKPAFQRDYRAHIREVRDLLWQKDQLEPLIRQVASFYAKLEKPDIDRWRLGTAASGRQYFSPAGEATLEGKIADMLKFAFTGGSWAGGDVGAGGRAAFLDSFADASDKSKYPKLPTVTYSGPDGFPIDGLRFKSSAFSDPQTTDTLMAMKWRIARVTKVASPSAIPLTNPQWRVEPVHLEIQAAWESEDLPEFQEEVSIPVGPVLPGATYRVRVRHQDSTGLWSHWSLPVEFVAGPAAAAVPTMDSLRITEVMYDPAADDDLEFVEILNRGSAPVDLTDVRLGGGASFAFKDGTLSNLGPGEYALVVSNADVFRHFYDATGLKIAGEFTGKLGNSGERLTLSLGLVPILDFTFASGWYPETAGKGRSLTIRDPGAATALWSDPVGWFASSVDGGTPGRADPASPPLPGLLRPGDANLDGNLDLTDPILLLFILFQDAGHPLPCTGAGVSSGGNLQLLDVNGDGSVDLSDAVHMLQYLYMHGGPPALGEECVRIDGCPDACK